TGACWTATRICSPTSDSPGRTCSGRWRPCARAAVLAQYRRLLDGDPHLLADVGLARADVLRAMETLRAR
ncbi:hypothetical protein CNY89_30245, partial [Amaricoccus sp. HAR-UPW-R2A-40]